MKKNTLLSVAFTLIVCVAAIGNYAYADGFEERIEGRTEASIPGMIVGALVGVVVAAALLPTIANTTATLEDNTDLDTAEQTLVGQWTLLIIVGVMLAIIGLAL